MNQDTLISVIVPVYKVEKYLDRCVESIVNQTYLNLEIILVDDGSPDSCPAMCDAWAQKDSRIKVIHKENGGLSDSRNAGMAAASGAYIGFVDGDDYIAPEMYRLLLERIREEGSDISACGAELVFEDGTAPRPLTKSGTCVLDRETAMEAVVRESWLKQPVWYKLYKTALIRDIPFPVGKYHEDVFWTWQAVARAKSVSVFDTPCYFYVQRRGSIMAERYSLRRLDAVEAKCQRLEFLEKAYPQLAACAREELFFFCLFQGQKALLHPDREERDRALSYLEQVRANIPESAAGEKLTRRIWRLIAERNFRLCCRLRNALKIGL